MRIAFVSTGQLPIPAPGYGGIELVLHYYRQILECLGHEVRIVNVMGGASIARRLRIVREVNSFRPDLAHIHASKYFNLSRWLRCRGIFLTDHAPERKRQHLLCGIPGLYFAGPVEEEIALGENYLGEWSREQVENDLTDYANLVLLSQSEGHANVCLEAMAGGLGLVVSEAGATNLDVSLPFIDVVPEEKITDRDYVTAAIAKNRDAALGMRRQIRDYAKKNFDVAQIIERQYLPLARATLAARPLVDS